MPKFNIIITLILFIIFLFLGKIAFDALADNINQNIPLKNENIILNTDNNDQIIENQIATNTGENLIINSNNIKKIYLATEDFDKDGLSDKEENEIYHTDPNIADTDNDGFIDGDEIKNNYSPLNLEKIKLDKNDYDKDGLSDKMEILFKTDLTNSDTDGDGYKDGEEIKKRFNPNNKEKIKLDKKIEINLDKQRLSYFLGGINMGTYPISSGIGNSTLKGKYKIINKYPKAWSSYGLWMPYWLGLGTGKFGIHELPIWPNGYREGENHLGKKVSHGCIRLGIGPAKLIYDWAEVGTPVIIN